MIETYCIDNDGDNLGAVGSETEFCNASVPGNFVSDCTDDQDNCAGVVDDCGVCNGDNADQDCNGNCFGSAVVDDCGVCDGGNADQDCNGDCFGSAVLDDCGVCDGDNANQDCEGDCFG